MNVQEVAAQYGEYLIEKRRYFHQHPEVSTKGALCEQKRGHYACLRP